MNKKEKINYKLAVILQDIAFHCAEGPEPIAKRLHIVIKEIIKECMTEAADPEWGK